jgi:dihydroxy-acid dehydratase
MTQTERRSAQWFGASGRGGMTYRGWMRSQGFTPEVFDGRPVIGIATAWSELAPCNVHLHRVAESVKRGVWQAGGFPLEFPVMALGETLLRPTAMLYRNLLAMEAEELMRANPLDGVVLLSGCDKTTPGLLMAASSTDLPAVMVTGGPMLNGKYRGQDIGSGTVVWRARERFAAGEIDRAAFIKLVASAAPSTGYCNTMGTATTMNSLAEVLGMSLPGSAAIPAPHRDRQECAYETGRRIVEMIHADRKPSDILTREAFINAIRVNSALGGSTNSPLHLIALARHIGVELSIDDWQTYGYDIPLLVNLQPAGEYLGEDFYRAGGVPAVVAQLLRQGLLYPDALTANGRTIGDNCAGAAILDEAVIRPFERPLADKAGFLVLRGNLFDSAIMKTSVISEEFRRRYLSNKHDPDAFEGRAIVFDGPEDYHARIDDPALNIDSHCVLFMRGTGPIGYPGGAEVVNMRAPVQLIAQGVHVLPCIGDGRQSGTSGSPSILNAAPEAAIGGGLAVLQTGDRIRIDLRKGEVNVLLSDADMRERREALEAAGGYAYPASQTPWQEMQRGVVGQMDTGSVLEPAVKYQRIARTKGIPRHNH